MAEVAEHADAVHLRQDFLAEAGEAAVNFLQITGTGIVLRIVGELHDPDAEILEDLHVIELVFERRRVLPADDDAGLVLRLGGMDIGDSANRTENVVVFTQEALPFGNVADALAEILPEQR